MNNSFSVKSKAQYIQITVEGKDILYLDKKYFGPYLKERLNQEMSFEELYVIEKKVAWHYALKVIAQRGISSHLLKKKIIDLGISQEVATLAIDFCVKKGLLNDEKRIEALINFYFSQGKGPRLIQQKLKIEFDLSHQEVFSYFETYLSEELQGEKIKTIIQARLNGRDKEKTIRFLLQRGFLLSTIKAVL